jgi:hypothetical protein
VRPGPWSGEPGNSNGTPVAKRLGRLQVNPDRAQPGAVQDLELVEAGADRLGALDVEHGRQRAVLGVELRRGADEPQRAGTFEAP